MPNFTPDDLGVDLIRAERERQIIVEGHTPDHDMDHGVNEFVCAAVAYLFGDECMWPWESELFKPTHPINEEHVRDLVKAGALIAAAIDRLQADEPDSTPCCPDPQCSGNPCTFPGYANNH